MTAPTPLLDFFKRGEVPRDVRLLAAQGALSPQQLEAWASSRLAALRQMYGEIGGPAGAPGAAPPPVTTGPAAAPAPPAGNGPANAKSGKPLKLYLP